MHAPSRILLALLAGPACAAADPAPENRAQATPELVERSVSVMGTLARIEIHASDGTGRAEALAASERALRALEAVEARLTTWSEESELARLNRATVGEAFLLSPELAADLARAHELWRRTDGAFDPGIGALVHAWGLRSGGRRPAPAALEAARASGGLAGLELSGDPADGGATYAVRRHAGLVLEEGAFGKGVGLDAALAELRGLGIRRALIDLGGQVGLLADDGGPFVLAVADPRDRGRAAVQVEVVGGSLATTGNSERGIVVDGVRRSHVLDPRTGEPAPDFGSVSVWAADATTADALSTALYVLGPDAALAWATGWAGVEVLVLEARGDRLVARASAGLAGRVVPLAPELEFTSPLEERP